MATRSDRARRLAISLLSTLVVASCDPYHRFSAGDDSLGPVNPAAFPPANLGARGDRTRAGVGTFVGTAAFVAGTPAAYFAYPVPPALLAADPLALSALAMPVAYDFDGACQPPARYAYDQRRDEVRLDQQGSIFTALPQASYLPGVAASSTYVPIVMHAAVSAAGLSCQKLKSATALARAGLAAPPDGKHLAWLIIDPAAGVYLPDHKPDDPGLGLQSWGWFNRYLVAYLDGGEVPVDAGEIVTQKLYYPRSLVSVTRAGPDGAPMTTMAAGRLGAGYDVLAARRGDAGYSPLCRVFTYDTTMPTDVAALPRDAQMIEGSPLKDSLQPATPPFVYCLQVR